MTKTPKSAPKALHDHAAGRDTLRFSELVLQGKLRFDKGMVVRFEDPAVAAYLDIAFNGTDFTDDEPTRTVGNDEINFDPDDPSGNDTIDPQTVIGNGRGGVTAGATVHKVAAGDASGSGDAPLNVHDVTVKSEG